MDCKYLRSRVTLQKPNTCLAWHLTFQQQPEMDTWLGIAGTHNQHAQLYNGTFTPYFVIFIPQINYVLYEITLPFALNVLPTRIVWCLLPPLQELGKPHTASRGCCPLFHQLPALSPFITHFSTLKNPTSLTVGDHHSSPHTFVHSYCPFV